MTDDPLVPVFMPALVVLLLNGERSKGSPLVPDEVAAIRDGGTCVMVPLSQARQIQMQRGYDDLNPENAWEEWQAIRDSLLN